MTKLPPRQPGWHIFHGIRHSTRRGAIESIHEPVKVIRYPYPTFSEQGLAVVMAGRATPYPLSAFAGEWESLEVSA